MLQASYLEFFKRPDEVQASLICHILFFLNKLAWMFDNPFLQIMVFTTQIFPYKKIKMKSITNLTSKC